MSTEVEGRSRKALGSTWALAAVAAVPIAVLIAYFGLRNHYYFGDESIGTFGARQIIGDFPHALWDPNFSSRPLERLVAWAWAFCFEVMPTTAGAFQLAHILQAAATASLTIPVALVARGLGVSRNWSVAAGVLAVLGPFTIAGTTLLNNGVGVTALAWVLVAGQRVTTRPGWRSDALFLTACVIAGMARGGNLPLVAGVGPAILVAAWSRTGNVKTFARELVVRHWLLVLVAIAAAGLFAARGVTGVVGTYGAGRSTYLPWDVLLPGMRTLGAHLAVGTGIIALAFAVPWILRAITRPLSAPERHFGLTAFTTALLFIYVYAPALNEDRYFLVLTPLVAVAFVHAFTVRRLGLGWLVAGAALLGLLLRRGMYWPDSPDAFVVMPTSQWWNRVITGRASELPLFHHWMLWLGAALAAMLVGWLLIALDRRVSRTGAIAVTVFGLMMVSQTAGAVYNMDRWTTERGLPTLSFADRTRIDRIVPDGRTAVLLRANPTEEPLVAFRWNDMAFFNQKLEGTIDLGGPGPCCLGGHVLLDYDITDGRVTSPVASEYLATPVSPTVAFAGRTIGTVPSEGFRVDVIASPPRLAFIEISTRPEAVRLLVFPRSAGDNGCLTGELGGVVAASIDGQRARITRSAPRASVRIPDHPRASLVLRHRIGEPPLDLRLGPCAPA